MHLLSFENHGHSFRPDGLPIVGRRAQIFTLNMAAGYQLSTEHQQSIRLNRTPDGGCRTKEGTRETCCGFSSLPFWPLPSLPSEQTSALTKAERAPARLISAGAAAVTARRLAARTPPAVVDVVGEFLPLRRRRLRCRRERE